MRQLEWELEYYGEREKDEVARVSVPGGWFYRYTYRNWLTGPQHTITFVPFGQSNIIDDRYDE